jgi:protein-S-isoprenylcysteine O-methyltransferase Ste14
MSFLLHVLKNIIGGVALAIGWVMVMFVTTAALIGFVSGIWITYWYVTLVVLFVILIVWAVITTLDERQGV